MTGGNRDEAWPTGERGMGVLEAIRTRRSVGKVRPERPPRAAIAAIIEAATWAPNHRLTEPWRFVVLAGEARRAFGIAMAEAQAAKRAGLADPTSRPDGDEARGAADEARGGFAKTAAKPLRAPVIVAVAVEPVVGPKVVEIEEITAGAAAVQNMLLAAHALGLAAIWRTGDAAYDAAIKRFLGLDEGAHLLGFVYVGYPEGATPERSRAPADSRTRWRGWDGEGASG